ncbi:hypothetical protein [Erythrobacter litoralis]|uniref:Rap1a immunity protein domain-containing protein n=1 Tax=Erythrobacter litoralis (strain HTCC2594) TaxID=314225 RepID=Q2N7P8_ERYLH|nr:hypothetical protein [Erythrobacter litoralis]ABC64293.1 hypothetical protein ELI_11005 [Erythrobacter litoralis HTCC2594]
MRFVFIGSVLLATTAPAAAAPGDMDVQTFLAKAEKLEKKGALALLSSDLKVLKREAEGAAKTYRTRIVADQEAGRQPHSCPPKGKQAMTSDELLGHLRSYPAAKRPSVSMKTAFADLMQKRFPCS